MTEERRENREYCDCHGKNMARINHLEKSDNHSDIIHERMWDAIKDRLPIKYYMALITVLVILFGGNFAFGLAIYEKLSSVERSVAVVEIQLIDLKNHRIKNGG